MPNFNKYIGCGNLTRDPELIYTPKGSAICKLGIAINESWKGDNGEKKESVTFLDVTAFGKTGEAIAQYLKKGRPILFEGKLRTESWTDKATNQPRSKLGVVLESFQFMDSGGGNTGGSPARPAPAPRQAAPPTAGVPSGRAAPAPMPPDVEDDVPF